MISDRLIWIWLSLACGPGSTAYNKLFASFDTLREIYEAPEERFLAVDGIDKQTARALADKDMTRAQLILSQCIKNHWGVLTYGDKGYPKRLKTLVDPPVVLYYKGRFIDLNDEVCIAVVGTRTMTEYGERQAHCLSYAMAAGGAVIVSGMALGCDAMAANGALDAGKPTVAVLGCGIDVVYPKEHFTLSEHIARTGMIITEYTPGSEPDGRHFPVRNRIISGLSQGTVVVEAPAGSGALITAKTALYQGRDIFAVPGELGNRNSEGCNALIRSGAHVVTSAADVLGIYEFIYPHKIYVSACEHAEREMTEKGMRDSAKLRRIASRPVISPEKKKEDRERRKEETKIYKKDLTPSKKTVKAPSVPSYSFLKDREEQKPAPAPDPSPVKLTPKDVPISEGEKQVPAPAPDPSPVKLMPKDVPISEGEQALLVAMGQSEVTPDELMSKGFSAADIMSGLTVLEILGYVTSVPGGRYVRVKK